VHTPKNQILDILLVEDNPADVVLMEEILEDSGIQCNMHTAYDGEEAMAFLRREGVYAKERLPALIILDLNIPKKNGHEVLHEIKSDEDLKHIPVIVMTTSRAEEDVLKSYRMHANCYIVKPVGTDEFMNVIRAIDQFWFNTVRLPTFSI